MKAPVFQNPVVSTGGVCAITYQQHGMVECDCAAFCTGVNAITVELQPFPRAINHYTVIMVTETTIDASKEYVHVLIRETMKDRG